MAPDDAGAAPNRPGFAAALGGGPAGVVEGMGNSGFEGVVEPRVAPEFVPAKRPPVEGVVEAAPAAPPNIGVDERFVVAGGVAAEPKSPPV